MEFFNLDLGSELLAFATRKEARAHAKELKKADPNIKRTSVRKGPDGLFGVLATYKKPKQ